MAEIAVPVQRERRTFGCSVDVTVGGEPGVLTVGRASDGAPRRMELRAGVHGSTLAGLADALATAITVGLQHGVPADVLADALRRAALDSPGDGHAALLAETFAVAPPPALVVPT
ncbi:hypothetical protein ACFO1B_48705 [Dactylosporangium siamense]|uniref:ribonucleoside-diphosphate reductase n=1 Tax=Dactylosporangium siamense TaxID=685454 RepID=A0A919UJ08_9ACTN|nr:hypothetical protein [Dactylosporangium siamense]GIG52183.1 hypothetical protein Dsi01nite_102240 [Dactylosporangium siamense]